MLEPGRALTLRDGDDVTIVAVGTMVSRALDAAEALAGDGIGARVINMPFVDPLDEATLLEAARDTRGIVTVEEAIVSGGLGAAVASLIAQHQPDPDADPRHHRLRPHRQRELPARPLRPDGRRHRLSGP